MKKIIKKIKKYFNRKIDDKDITLEELKELRKKGVKIIDVRSFKEYKEGHINGAISIPEYEINKEILNKINTKKPIIVYCTSGQRSKKAKKKLEQLGYENVYNLYEGWEYQVI